ncbi:MAG: hypothetical protein IMZ55_04085, partial [Acidobacteria bacterium]|nr:hypothetical protein [Acidobacteriota bacterium]
NQRLGQPEQVTRVQRAFDEPQPAGALECARHAPNQRLVELDLGRRRLVRLHSDRQFQSPA